MTLHRHLRWSEAFTRQVVRQADGRDLVEPVGEQLELTPAGRDRAQHDVVGRRGQAPDDRPPTLHASSS